MRPVFIAGMRGTGKTTAAKKLREIAEIVDGEYLQYKAASVIDPDSPSEAWHAWKFWTGDRLRQLPHALNDVFLSKHGSNAPAAPVLAVSAAILVKDWFFAPLAAVLAVHRPSIDWSCAQYLVLDYAPQEILARIQGRNRPFERKITLEFVQDTARSYREHHVLQSLVPWQLIKEPVLLDELLQELHQGKTHPANPQ
ncbi:MAG TPA: hypothetical protein VGQ91_00760, partial [Ideonella sp.]|nr:hypothetical protein [Ideonella sp.]